jgi:hypothetical protein
MYLFYEQELFTYIRAPLTSLYTSIWVRSNYKVSTVLVRPVLGEK